MVTSSAADVVLVSFPFSDLSQAKLRPAVVLANAGRKDWILCQVTSNRYADRKALEIVNGDFLKGSLQRTSYARPGKLFTANHSLIVSQVGTLKPDIFKSIIEAVVKLLRHSLRP